MTTFRRNGPRATVKGPVFVSLKDRGGNPRRFVIAGPPRLFTVGRGPVPRRASVAPESVRGRWVAGVFRSGREIARGTLGDS